MNIFWDMTNHQFVASLTNSQVIESFSWYCRDTLSATLYLLAEDSNGALALTDPPSGYVPRLAGKQSSALAGAALIYTGDWTKTTTGTYTGTISLNTSELIAALGTSTSLTLILEATLDSAGSNTDTTQVALYIYPDVIRGTESAPSSLTPWFEFFTDDAGLRCLRLCNDNGQTLQVFKPIGA